MVLTPLISIIVPVYNVESLLGRCVESLLAQDYPYLDIMLIDDGSTDNSLSIAEKYAKEDSRIRVISQKNRGVSRARNTGLNAIYGEYVCFVDSDDFVDNDYISNFIKGLERKPDLVFQGLTEIHPDNTRREIIPEHNYYSYSEVLNGIADINKYRIFGYVCNKLYKTSIIKQYRLRFPEDISISEDRIFALHYLRYVHSMQVMEGSAYKYDLHPTGLTLRKRTYSEIKKAADINLEAAMYLLSHRKSERFLHDTRRVYIMTSLAYFTALFTQKNSWESRIREVAIFKKNYSKWLSEYTPTTRNHRIICNSLILPTHLSVFIQYSYWLIKNLYEKIAKISKS